MIEPEELLQQRLEQLEAGQPLATCLQGLPERETRILQMIAALKTVPFPEEDTELIAAQRANVLGAARTELTMKPTPVSDVTNTTAIPLLDRLRDQLDRLLSRRELATGLASVLVLIGLLVVGVGLSRWRDGRQEQIAAPGKSQVAGEGQAAGETAPEASVEPDATAAPTSVAGVATGEAVAEAGSPPADAEVVAPTPGQQLFIPFTSNPLILNPQTAAVEEINGLVEIQSGDVWTAVAEVATLTAGQRLRTGQLSGATLTFFDGSQAFLGPETEISIDELDAQRPEDGLRTIALTQWLGESEHSVEFRNDQGSRYQVNTPGGNGLARGTRFGVTVTPDLLARFAVSEGRVDVSNLNATVAVIAGQLTTTMAGRPPAEPVFRVAGEGEVSQTGTVWTIAGQTFQTNEATRIVGNPQVGDLVRVEGHLLPDGGRVADRILLLQRATTNRFRLTGEVEATGAAAWTIAGQSILVNDNTRIEGGIGVGNTVRVEGVIQPGGALQAEHIRLLAEAPGLPFSFTGVVQRIDPNTWRISGQTIAVNENTAIDSGLAVGDVVAVRGRILDNGRWRAQRIERVSGPERPFELTGVLESRDPWRVGGITLATRNWSVIEPGLEVGQRVRVRGVILPDGTWVASYIGSLDDDDGNILVFVGVVNSVNPLIINGIPLVFDNNGNDNSRPGDDIRPNTLVQVRVRLLADGRWVIVSIRVIHSSFGLGCLTVSSVVVSVSTSQIVLRHWPAIPLGGAVNVAGDARVNSVVTFPVCTDFDGTIIITNIVVIYNSVIIIVPPPAGNQNNNGSFRPPARGNGNSNGNHNG